MYSFQVFSNNDVLIAYRETEKAFQLLPTMKDLGFSVTNETYAALLRAHAKHGDVNAILSEIERLKTKRIYLKDRDILNLIYDLSVNGYGEKAACLMDLFVKNEGFVRAATNTVIRLVNAEQFDVVIKLLKTFPIKAYATGKNVNIGGFVLKQLVRHNRSRDEIMSICKQMEEEGLHSSPYSVVESQSMEIQPGPSHRIWTAIYASKIKATPLTEYNFRPLFFTCNDSEAQGIVRKMITEFKITPSLQFLVTNVLPKLNYQPVDATINKLLGLNVPASLAALAVVYQCLERNDLKNAADILNHFKLHVPVAIFKPLLISALTSTDDVRSFVLFLCINHKNLQHSKSVRKSGTDKTSESVSEISNEHNDRKINNFWSRIMCDTFTKLIGDERSTTIEAILKNLVEQGVTISTSEADRIKSEIQNFVTDDMIKHLDKLASGELQLHSIEKSNIRTKPNSIRLEKIISETKVEDKSSEYFELLKAYHREGEYEKYEMLVQRLETESVQIPSTVHERLIDIRLKAGDLKDSLALFDKHRAENKDFYLYKQTLTKMTSMLIENQQFNEALIVLQKSRKSKEFIADYWDCEQYFLLLTKLADGGKITELNQLFDCLLENRHIIVSNKLLGPLVKVHLVNKNLSKAVEVFESLAKRFHVTPLKNILFTQLIIAEDPTNIQRVQEISSSVHGMHNVLTDLAICYIECGYIDEAQHLFDNANVYPAQRIIMGNADRYLKEGFAFHLEKLLLVTKYWKNVKEEPIRMHLLQIYIQRNQLEKVKEMYATLQDENIIPSKEFLSTMNNYFYLQNEYASSFQKPIPRKVPVPKHSNQNQTDRIDASDIK